MLILAIDLGKAKSLACWYQTDDASHAFRTALPLQRLPRMRSAPRPKVNKRTSAAPQTMKEPSPPQDAATALKRRRLAGRRSVVKTKPP